MIYDIIDADVLVVGAGGAGLRATIEAHENGADVIVVSKGIVGKSGLTQTAVTGYQAAFGYADPQDNPEVHFEDSVRGSYFLADQSLVEVFTKEAPQSVLDLERFGAKFDRGPDGKLVQKITGATTTWTKLRHFLFSSTNGSGCELEFGRNPLPCGTAATNPAIPGM
jgi:succinate dehydrogenase/fumarate reductase flavoprotein subunit